MRLRSIVVGIVVVASTFGVARGDVLLGARAGASHFAWGDLADFWDEVGLEHDTDDVVPVWEFDATWRFAQRHAAVLSIGRMTSSTTIHYFFEQNPSTATFSTFDLKTIPICLSYELVLRESSGRARTSLGAGVGYYISKIEVVETYSSYDPNPVLVTQSYGGEGNGYGFHGYLRQTAPISERLSLAGTLRGRWVDAMAFEDDNGSVATDFTGVDITVGLEARI